MFLVVSRWKPFDGKREEFESKGREMRAVLRSQPGVAMIETFEDGDAFVAVHAYESEDAYQRVIQDPNGVFNRKAQEMGLESVAEWLGSQRGPTLD